ncbi:MAG: glycine zipper 2TM domain-containing protein [Xanthomonadales bacterium]|nr:glycine zipper 2TM domain-containing protein [Xanthomonadales bacterium]
MSLGLAACASQPGYYGGNGNGYGNGYSQVQRCDRCGTVRDVEQVWVSERNTGTGAVLGAIIGGAIGNQVGSGNGRKAATAAGAVAGGVIGNNVEKNRRDAERAYRFEVRMDNGNWAQVTQRDSLGLNVGDRVVIDGRRLRPLY